MSRKTLFRSWRWNGQEIRPFRGGIPLDDRGFRYGQHIFESIAVRNGSPILGSEHLSLLATAAKRKGIPLLPSLVAAFRNFLRDRSLRDGMLRIYLTAGPGAPASPVRNPGCFLTWEAARFPGPVDVAAGIRLATLGKPFTGGGWGESWGEKSGNYAAHILALESARAEGVASADEGIVLDQAGKVLSCAMGNLLVWMTAKPGVLLCTPSTSDQGARSGAVLGWVRGHATVLERDLRMPDLRRAVAMAVTNSRIGVMPVSSLDGSEWRDPSLSLALAQEYLRSHGLLRRS